MTILLVTDEKYSEFSTYISIKVCYRTFDLLKWVRITDEVNEPLPSSKYPNFQNEAKCTIFLVQICFI